MIKENGFTLIEIIASLLLVGFMAVFAGMGIVTFTKAYLFTKENAHIAQKAQLAMTRINRELMELLNVTNASNTDITIDSPSGIRTIGLNDGKIKIAASGTLLADGDVLIDNVSGFSLSYWSGTQSWAQGINDIRLLSAIQVGLTISRSDTGLGNLSFATTIHPRNNNNYGGAPLASQPPTELDYCFLATAAYGSLEHPAVQVLRQFRDKFLLTWRGGRTLVGIYYSTGPSFAHIIRDHQWAGCLVRLLLYPLIAFSFLLLNLPAAIPLILFLTWLITRIFFILIKNRYSRRSGIGDKGSGFRVQGSGFMDQGSILVALIIAMLFISALGAAMLPLTATSTFSRMEANSGTRAYFLAESGLRYAASQYLNAGSETAKNDQLEAVHNQTYTLANDDGQFHIDIYPFFFITTSDPAGTNTLNTKVPGGYPSDLVLSSGRLKIGFIREAENRIQILHLHECRPGWAKYYLHHDPDHALRSGGYGCIFGCHKCQLAPDGRQER